MTYDLIIIGAGPAGVSAALYAKSRGLNLLLIEKDKVGGIIGTVSAINHYASVSKNQTGEDFACRLATQLKDSDIDVTNEDVLSVKLEGKTKEVTTNNATYLSKAVIIANGSTPKKLDTIGGDEHYGKSFGINAFKNGEANKGKEMFVIGGAGGAAKETIYLSSFAKTVTMVCIENELPHMNRFNEKIKNIDNIKVKTHTKLVELKGKDFITSLVFEDLLTGEREEVFSEKALVFVNIGLEPNTKIYTELEIEKGYIVVNRDQQTNIEGVFAAGDICSKKIRQVATAVSDGAIAAIEANTYISSMESH